MGSKEKTNPPWAQKTNPLVGGGTMTTIHMSLIYLGV